MSISFCRIELNIEYKKNPDFSTVTYTYIYTFKKAQAKDWLSIKKILCSNIPIITLIIKFSKTTKGKFL